MKHTRLTLLWCALSLLFSLPAVAQDYMTASITPDNNLETWTLELSLENPEGANYTAFQMDIKLPEGFTLVEHSAAASTRLPDHSVAVNAHPSGVYKLVAYSLTNTAIVGNSGCVAMLTVTADASVTTGDYSAELSNIILSDRAGYEAEFDDASFTWFYIAPPQYFTITYFISGGFTGMDQDMIWTEQHPAGEPIALSEPPGITGCSFVGYSYVPEVMPYEDITIELIYQRNSYTITYILDGEVYATEECVYGTPITPLEVPSDEYRTFNGWSNLPDLMPAHDITVTGTTTLTDITSLPAALPTRVAVYSLSGMCIAKGVTLEWIKQNLRHGVYIINGKKWWIGGW